MGDVVNFMPPGMFALADLPQRGPLGRVAFGSGWSELDTIFKFYPGQFTVVTGLPNHGKSTLLLNVLAKMAREQGVTSFLYGPENEHSIGEKMRLLWPGNDESFDHFAAQRFIVQSSEAFTADEPLHDIDWVLDRASWAVDNRKVEVVMIDPWNELEMVKPRDLPMTDYIRECIKKMKDFVRSHKVAFVIVVHPTKDAAQNGRVPSLYDCEGSAHWWNKSDNGLIVHRDKGHMDTCKIISAKVRELGAGMPGECLFWVDRNTGMMKPKEGCVCVY